MINSTDDFISFLQTKKPIIQSKEISDNLSKKKVSFSNSVTFYEKDTNSSQKSVYNNANVTSSPTSPLWNRDREQVQHSKLENLNMQVAYSLQSKRSVNANNEGLALTTNHDVTESQSDIVPSFKRSVDRTRILDESYGNIDLLFGDNINSDRTFDVTEKSYFTQRIDEESNQSSEYMIVNEESNTRASLATSNSSAQRMESVSKPNSSYMSRQDSNQQSFSPGRSYSYQQSDSNQRRHAKTDHEPCDSLESILTLMKKETSTMFAQIAEHLSANTSLMQKIQEAQSNTSEIDEYKTKGTFMTELQKQTSHIDDLFKHDKDQLNNTISKLEEILNYVDSTTQFDRARIREEEARLSKLHESLLDERKEMMHNLDVERKRILGERVALDQMNHQMKEEIRRDRELIQHREDMLNEKENEFNRQYADMRMDVQALQYEKEKIARINDELTTQLEDLKGQRERIELQKLANDDVATQLDKERRRLQDMAEKLSSTSHAVAMKSREAEEVLNYKNQLDLERIQISKDRTDLMEQMQSMKQSKIDLARQRVFFLKEKVMLSKICT